MVFFCCAPRTGAVVVGVLNLTIGLFVLAEFFWRQLQTDSGGLGPNEDSNSTQSVSPTIETSSNVTVSVSGDSGDEEWLYNYFEVIRIGAFYFLFFLLLTANVAGCVCALISVCGMKIAKRLAQAAALLIASNAAISFGLVVIQFIFGVHWIDLLALLLWFSILNIYFAKVLIEYRDTFGFRRIPVSA